MEEKNDNKRWNRRNEAHPLSPRKMTLRSLLLVAETSMSDTENGNVNHKESWKKEQNLGGICWEKRENKIKKEGGVCGEERELKMVMSGKKVQKFFRWVFLNLRCDFFLFFCFALCALLCFSIYLVCVCIDWQRQWHVRLRQTKSRRRQRSVYFYFIFILILESHGLFVLNTFIYMLLQQMYLSISIYIIRRHKF